MLKVRAKGLRIESLKRQAHKTPYVSPLYLNKVTIWGARKLLTIVMEMNCDPA